MTTESFKTVYEQLLAGEREIVHGTNEFIGHADVVKQLLDVAPQKIKSDFQFLHDLLCEARDATGMAVLGIFPRLCDPNLAGVEGRISDFIAEHCGVRLDDGDYHCGELIGESQSDAWPAAGSPLTSNRFPYLLDTSASNYFSNRFWNGSGAPEGFVEVPEGGKVVFKGQYLRCRYFAFHPSDFDTNTLPTLVDEDIVPDSGSVNPFCQATEVNSAQYFTAQLTFNEPPAVPEPNTMYAGKKRDGESNPAVFLLLRTTDSVLGAMPPNSTGVPLPSLTVYDADGNIVQTFEKCDPYPPGTDLPYETTRFASLPIPDHRTIVAPEAFNTRSNWGLPYDILASDDILYLNAPYTRRLGDVLVVRGKALTTANPPEVPVYAPGLQIRGFTLTNYNFWAGICNDALVDQQLLLDENGYYTVVLSTQENRPANAQDDKGVNWMDWGPYLDGQLTFRLLLRQNPLLLKLKAQAHGEIDDPEIVEYLPVAKHCSQEQFESGAWRDLF